MPRITADDVLQRVWNDLGTKASDSNSEYDPSSNSGSESKGIGGAGNSDSEEAKASDPSQENEDEPCLYLQTKSSWHLMFPLRCPFTVKMVRYTACTMVVALKGLRNLKVKSGMNQVLATQSFHPMDTPMYKTH